jgi:hypothetical protein
LAGGLLAGEQESINGPETLFPISVGAFVVLTLAVHYFVDSDYAVRGDSSVWRDVDRIRVRRSQGSAAFGQPALEVRETTKARAVVCAKSHSSLWFAMVFNHFEVGLFLQHYARKQVK